MHKRKQVSNETKLRSYLQFIDNWWHQHQFKENKLTEKKVFDVFLSVVLLSQKTSTYSNQHGETMLTLEKPVHPTQVVLHEMVELISHDDDADHVEDLLVNYIFFLTALKFIKLDIIHETIAILVVIHFSKVVCCCKYSL